MSGKLDGSQINKHQNTNPTEQQNLAVRLTLDNILLKVNENSFPVLKPKVLCGKFTVFRINIGSISVMYTRVYHRTIRITTFHFPAPVIIVFCDWLV